MTIELIGVGYGRTGTLSTQIALARLGFPCYHMLEVLENKKNKGHMEFWLEVARSPSLSQHDWSRVFQNYSATIDNPASCVWRELMVAYPKAKVLLTLHPKGAESWYQSSIDTIYFSESSWHFKVLKFFVPFARKMGEMTHKLIWQRNHKGTMGDRDAAIAEYHQHAELVKSQVPNDKLLVFTADQGWDPLCQFLGVEVPDEEFPNVNDRAEMKRRLVGIKIAAYVLITSSILVIAGIAYLLCLALD